MTARGIRSELARLQRRHSYVTRELQAVEATFNAEVCKERLAVGPLRDRYDERAVAQARNRVAELRADREAIVAHIKELSAQLPSSETVLKARHEAEGCIGQMREADEALNAEWTRFRERMGGLEAIARELASLRQQRELPRARAMQLTEEFDLEVSVPTRWEPDASEIRLVLLVFALCQQAMSGAISLATEATLQSAREERGADITTVAR